MMTSAMGIAQNAQPFQVPPKEILDLVDIKPRPVVRIDSRSTTMVLLDRSMFKTLDELAQPELKLAGLRINPQNNGQSRSMIYYGIQVMDIATGKIQPVTGLPEKPAIGEFSFSPDETRFAFTITNGKDTKLWWADVKECVAHPFAGVRLNGVMGFSYQWTQDSRGFLILGVSDDRPLPAAEKPLPEGPSVQESSGRKAPARTFQDLLRTPTDEATFEFYARAQVFYATIAGEITSFLPAAIYRMLSFSPDGSHLLVQTIEKPYSYIVPYYRFAASYDLYDASGKFIRNFYKKPLAEELPNGFDAVETGRRNINWRSDEPTTLYWAEALDGGDPAVETDFRDALYQLKAPFDSQPQLLMKTRNRFAGITWGDSNHAIVYDYWWKNRNTTSQLIDPEKGPMSAKMLFDRSSEDYYTDPGNFLTLRNAYHANVLMIHGNSIYLQGEGYSPEGNRPFVDRLNLHDVSKTRLWQADGFSTYESIVRVVNPEKKEFITSIESKTKNPNFYLRSGTQLKALTSFANPYESFMKVHKERVHYKRSDGVELSATLYLPAGYDSLRDGRLPMLMWAYPVEYKNKEQAGQIKESPHMFTQLFYGSPVYWAARGYAILDDADFPIIGEGNQQPNDSFIEQLVSNAAAAIDYAVGRGVADKNRVAIGGHSYGAFMVANLMANCDLFAAGIARSGAYNRTLTPFGFQSEERTFWEAPDVYLKMSPFVHADKINEPLLLIHGDADNNPGTFTLQSERLFGAIKGLGGTARLVLLPFESHGYSARENVLHVLWETDQWLEKYVKNKTSKH